MSGLVPSRGALQYLARLCAESSRPQASCIALHKLSTAQQKVTSINSAPVTQRRHSRLYTSTAIKHATSTTTSPSAAATHNTNATSPPTPDITNYYTLFPTTLPSGPPPSGPFHISLKRLRKEFLTHQNLHHPDKAPPGSPRHKQNVALSTLLNQAYKTLSSPLLRAQYLLDQTFGIDVTSEDNSAHPTDQTTLMEVMETQEAIEEASSPDEIEKLKEENQVRIDDTISKLAKAFEAGEGETAKNESVKLKYWTSLQDGLNDWEPGKEVRLIH